MNMKETNIGRHIARLEAEVKELEFANNREAVTIVDLQTRIQAMYDALVASGSINRIPEAHEWVGK